MPISIMENAGRSLLEIEATGRLTRADYESFVPRTERLIAERGKIRVLFDMHDFHGWDMGALWEDLKFDLKHFNDVERVAMLGETRWQKWMAAFCKPFTSATIRYFDHATEADAAREWIRSDGSAARATSRD